LLEKKDVTMRTIDLSPLYRSLVGFDRLAAQLDAAANTETASGYPPYNIERTDENSYRIEIAVAGFKSDELGIEVKENLLTVTGRKPPMTKPSAICIAAWPSAISSASSSWPTM
jgi:HSP20 family molecular chaperone IbpA